MRKDFNFVGYTYKIDDHEGRDIVKEEIDRFEVERLALERPVKMDMMKKPKQNQNEEMQGNHRQMLQRIHIGDKGCHKTEINTERSRGNSKSKSPFKVKDMNRGKAQKQGMSKSPIKVEKGISLTKKAATKAANVHTLAQLYATSELNRSTGPRKSSKKL